jgi:hypothetical protein
LPSIFEMLLSKPTSDALFGNRGFITSTPEKQEVAETIGKTVIEGFNSALKYSSSPALQEHLDETYDAYHVGFAYQGAGMGLFIMDKLSFGNGKRFDSFAQDLGVEHRYLMYFGAGMAFAKLPPAPVFGHAVKEVSNRDIFISWFIVDGYAFSLTYFNPKPTLVDKKYPRNINGYSKKVFDQGLGRSIWTVECMDVERVLEKIAEFDPDRHADLWQGVGLGTTYNGKPTESEVRQLMAGSKEHLSDFAQGVSLGVEARWQGKNMTDHARNMSRWVWNLDTEILRQLVYDSGEDVGMAYDYGDEQDPTEERPTYEIWRERIRTTFKSDHEEHAKRFMQNAQTPV